MVEENLLAATAEDVLQLLQYDSGHLLQPGVVVCALAHSNNAMDSINERPCSDEAQGGCLWVLVVKRSRVSLIHLLQEVEAQ